MALLFADGFEDYNSTVEMCASYLSKGVGWTIYDALGSGYIFFSTSAFRTAQNGISARSLVVQYGYVCSPLPALNEVIVGFGYFISSNTDTGRFFSLSNGLPTSYSNNPPNGIYLSRNSAGAIGVYRCSDNTLVGSLSADSMIVGGVWTYIEIRYRVDSSTGVIEVRVNGATAISFTGNTVAGASVLNHMCLVSASSRYSYYDDVYICDATGTMNNTFLGAVQIYTLIPTANSSVQMVPSTGQNFACVDDVPSNTTDFVTGNAVNQTDLYTFSDLPGTVSSSGVVPGVVVKARSTKPNSNNGSLQLVAESLGNVASSTGKGVPQGTWVNNHEVFETQPNSSAWSVVTVNAMTAGIKST